MVADFGTAGTQHDPAAPELDSGSLRLLAVLGVAVGCVALTTTCVVLIGGWVVGVDALKGVPPGFSTMKVNTAIGIGCLGAALVVAHADRRYSRIADTAASVAALIGLATLAEYAFHWEAGIDQLWIRDLATPPSAHPGRPAPATALMIALLGVALLCRGRAALAQAKTAAALTASVIAWAALNGYIFGARALQEVPALSSVALHTAILTLLLSLGALAMEPVSPPLRTVLGRGTGGIICRWLLPAAILVPPLLGWFIIRQRSLDFFPTDFGWALYSASTTLGSVWLILTLAHRITIIDAERQSATRLSRHDPLTGLANRRAFDSFLLENLNLSRRHGHALALLMVDIDDFKSYNDIFGHPAGDALLKSLSAVLSSLARETDLVARLGGDEFGIVLPETDAAGARVLAERVRAAVEGSTQCRRQVTVSVGVTTLSDKMREPPDLIGDCDSALYRAKSGGRNLVCVGGGPASQAPA